MPRPATKAASAQPATAWRRRGRALIGIAIAIGVYAAITSTGLVDTQQVPTIPAIARGLGDSWHELLSSVGTTLESWAIGLAIASAAGAVLGLAVGLSNWLDDATDIIVRMMRPMPSLALIPVAILIAGLGTKMTAGLVAFASFWPVFINARYAVRQVEPRLLDTARVLGLPRFQQVRRVIVPATAPAIVTGISVSVALALVVTVSVELVAGTGGLGSFVLVAQQAGATGQMYAAILVGGLVGWLLNALFKAASGAVLPWQAALSGER